MNRWNKGYEEVWCRRQVQICCWIAVTVDKGSRRVKFYQISEVVPIVIVFHFEFVVVYLYMNDDHRWQRQALGKTLSDHTSTCTYKVSIGTCVCQGYFNVYFLVIFRTKSVQSGPEQSCIRAGGLKPDILNTIHQILNSTPNTATFRIWYPIQWQYNKMYNWIFQVNVLHWM